VQEGFDMKKLITTVITLSMLTGLITQAGIADEKSLPRQDKKESQEDFEARIQWWREARFGMFVHWGPVSLKGTEISWSRSGERRGISGKGEIPI